jgi:TPR repeat protein
MKRLVILFVAGMALCICSAFVVKNPVGSIANQKAHDYYDKKNYKSALINYQKASKLGILEAQYYLANMYFEGKGSRKNKSKAIMWLKKSATGGFPPAQASMGLHYQFGSGVSKNLTQAYKLFLHAAKADNPDGQYFLAFLIATGQGTAKNSKKALKWFRIARSNGFPVPSNLLTLAGTKSLGKTGWVTKKELRKTELVIQIQAFLTKLGYEPGPVDGLTGKKTIIAIKSFQGKNGLSVDGKPSELLLIKIKKVHDPIRNKAH